MTTLVGELRYDIWNQLNAFIEDKYDMDCLWNKGGRAWKYEYKYRRGGKTLCALYARGLFDDFIRLLRIKRKPNRKQVTE